MPQATALETSLDTAPVIHHFDRDGRTVYYNAFTHNWVVVNSGESCPDANLSRIDFEFTPFEQLAEPHLMRVEVTQACNFRCKYCLVFENPLAQLNEHMSMATAEKLIRYYHEKMDGGSLMIMGGEPVLNWEVCKALIEAVPVEAGKEFYTTGLLLDDEKIDFLKRHNVSIRMSIDGFERHHAQRVDHAGKSHYKRIIERFKVMQEAGCAVGVNCTVTSFNLPELVEIHNYFVEELGARMFGYSIPHYAVNSPITTSIDMEAYTNAMLEIYESAKKNHLYVHQIMKRLAYLVRKRFKAIGCTVIGPEVTFYPDGRQTLCTKLDSQLQTSVVTPEMIYKNLPYFMEDCRQCPAIGICGGGCYWDAKMRFGRFQDMRECRFQQRLIERMLWDVVDWTEQNGKDFPRCLNETFNTRMFS